MFILSFSDLIIPDVIEIRDVLMKIIMMLKYTQSLRPNIYIIIKLHLIGFIVNS